MSWRHALGVLGDELIYGLVAKTLGHWTSPDEILKKIVVKSFRVDDMLKYWLRRKESADQKAPTLKIVSSQRI